MCAEQKAGKKNVLETIINNNRDKVGNNRLEKYFCNHLN